MTHGRVLVVDVPVGVMPVTWRLSVFHKVSHSVHNAESRAPPSSECTLLWCSSCSRRTMPRPRHGSRANAARAVPEPWAAVGHRHEWLGQSSDSGERGILLGHWLSTCRSYTRGQLTTSGSISGGRHVSRETRSGRAGTRVLAGALSRGVGGWANL